MITLLLTVFLVVLISAICSMTEAALYSVPWTYIENLRKQGSATKNYSPRPNTGTKAVMLPWYHPVCSAARIKYNSTAALCLR